MSEVYRGGIQAVPHGQHDAAAALGMTRAWRCGASSCRRRSASSSRRSATTSSRLFKDTALCSVVSIQEVVFTAQIIAARNFQYFTLYTLVGALYFAVSFPAARLVG